MTPTPTAPSVEVLAIPGIDAALAGRLSGSAAVLAGLLAAAALDEAGQPNRLSRFLFPDLDPEAVRRVWDAGLVVGYRAGLLAGRPRWDADALAAAREALETAGWEAMAATLDDPVAVARRAARVEPESVLVPEPW